ncbi:hypothetical protein Nepgr_016823 [Nepenthes gracilis]|uniref:Glycosyltransferase n=1 Tax=Nepenthes gracilis TaxID=150966 RepID=A0AAD3XRM7_NEPGR|nr:hypothetical protein Nepgr_016823 [Nepenthes gracilis]
MGHLLPAVAMAKRLVDRDDRISIIVLLVNLPLFLSNSFVQSLKSDASINKRIKFVEIPSLDTGSGSFDQKTIQYHTPTNSVQRDKKNRSFDQRIIPHYKSIVKQIVEERVIRSSSAGQLAGFVVDLFCTAMIDVASELNVPSYVLFTSNAALLSIVLHFQSLRDDHGIDVAEFNDPNIELDVPSFRHRIPYWSLPARLLDKDGGIMDHIKRSREAKGILVNTYMELEPYPLHSLSYHDRIPSVYPVGPIINLERLDEGREGYKDSIMRWLDDQPPSSVVFLCFGSLGTFPEEQVREIAHGLELSGHRFLWSIRREPTADEKVGPPREYDNLEDVLPVGFLHRTADIGRAIGWAPQVEILSHQAVGSFVSHVGWNSTLESLWFGVPVAAWPLFAEQRLNAFEMVNELGLAVEIAVDYKWDDQKKLSSELVKAEVIEKAIRTVMDMGRGERGKVKELSEASRKALMEGGSSYAWLGRFIEDVIENISE